LVTDKPAFAAAGFSRFGILRVLCLPNSASGLVLSETFCFDSFQFEHVGVFRFEKWFSGLASSESSL
jgi:hypothetical protein